MLPALLAGCVAAPRPAPDAPAAAVSPSSLYARIGGIDALRLVVPEFLRTVAADERINYLFAMSDLEALQGKLVDFFCAATGGPCKYAGRDMKAAHANLPIGPKHFDAMVEDLTKALDHYQVPAREKGEILTALLPLRGDIVSVR
jgi:hemoglobin